MTAPPTRNGAQVAQGLVREALQLLALARGQPDLRKDTDQALRWAERSARTAGRLLARDLTRLS